MLDTGLVSLTLTLAPVPAPPNPSPSPSPTRNTLTLTRYRARYRAGLHAFYISPIPPLYPPYISPASPLHLDTGLVTTSAADLPPPRAGEMPLRAAS